MAKNRWNSTENALKYILKFMDVSSEGRIVKARRNVHIGLKVKGCCDYLRDHDYLIVWKPE